MRLMKRLVGSLAILTIIAFLFVPPIIGLVLEKNTTFLKLPNFNHFDIEIIQYNRGWFTSNVTFKVKSSTNASRRSTQSTVPLSLIMQGHIQHGPFFYTKTNDIPRIGLALMTRRFATTTELRNLLKYLGLESAILQTSYAYLDLTGKYFDYFILQHFDLTSKEGVQIKFNILKVKIALNQAMSQIQGEIKLSDLHIKDNDAVLVFPENSIQFDMKKDPYGLWIGRQDVMLSHIKIQDDERTLVLSDVKLKGELNEENGLISGERQFDIEKIAMEGQPGGALHLKASVKNLNAQTISDLITTYQDTMRHGEMYEFQLKQRLIALIPQLLSKDTALELNHFQIQTPNGQLNLTAGVTWPEETSLGNLLEVIDAAKMKADFQVSIPLAHQIINLLARTTYLYQLSMSDRQVLFDLQETIRLNIQVIGYSILDLMDTGALSKEDGVKLLADVRDSIPLKEYLEEVKELLITKKISLMTSHQLIFLYTFLNEEFNQFDQQVLIYQKDSEEKIKNQINQYIAAGFIEREKNNYKVSVVRDKTGLKVNGHLKR